MVSRVRIGELLVDAGLLSQAQLERALEEQRAQGVGGRRLGQLIVSLGFVTEGQLARVLSQQLAVPWVSLAHIDFSPALLELVDREIAERHTVIPVYVRRERRDVDTLYLAMDDPTQDDVLRIVSERAKMPVRPMIAPPTDIHHAIIRAYGPRTDFDEEPMSSVFPMPLVKRPSQPRLTPSTPAPVAPAPLKTPPPPPKKLTPTPSAAPVLPAMTPDGGLERPLAATPDAPIEAPRAIPDRSTNADEEGPSIELAEPPSDEPPPSAARSSPPHSTPSVVTTPASEAEPAAETTQRPAAPESARSPAKMLSLTLLDGTTIQLPSAARARARTRHATEANEPAAKQPATVSDAVRTASATHTIEEARALLASLRAATEGLSSEERAKRWEGVVHALLVVLLRKGVVSERELIEALTHDDAR